MRVATTIRGFYLVSYSLTTAINGNEDSTLSYREQPLSGKAEHELRSGLVEKQIPLLADHR